MKRILIAGIGNIFLGDDAFGVEVVQELARRELPAEVRVVDFGIRGYDLACALGDGYDAVILVDATRQGRTPGTVYLIEPDLAKIAELGPTSVDAHSLDPVQVLRLAETLGGRPGRLYLVGCEAAAGDDSPGLGLSEVVREAVPKAVERIESLVGNLMGAGSELISSGQSGSPGVSTTTESGLAPA